MEMTDSLHSAPAHTAPLSSPDPAHTLLPQTQSTDEEAMGQEQLRTEQPSNPRQSRPLRQTGAMHTAKQAALPLKGDTVPAVPLQDSVAAKATRLGMAMDAPAHTAVAEPQVMPRTGIDDTDSWVVSGLLLLFLLVAFKMRRNLRYLGTLLHDTVNSRARNNMFVDTARETTFAILLNLLCVVGAGILLAFGIELYRGGEPAPGEFPPSLWPCMAVSAGFYAFNWIAYLLIGSTFTTRSGTHLWLAGFKACTSLLGLILFPIALLCVFCPQWAEEALLAALSLYFLQRLLFIFKGIRIFSAHRTYYILFLYYLCSVEIVPVLLAWQTACLFS